MGDCCNSLDLVPDQEEKSILQLKVVNLEKQLWRCVQSTGLMSAEAQLLYKQVCLCFEKLILCDMEFTEIQDVEYSLWKLHYKHIDEFRKRIRQKATAITNAGSPLPPRPPNGATVRQNNNSHIEIFKLFLSEATKFYQDLLLKVRKRYSFLEEKSGFVVQSQATIRNCQFMCHRFLICIGDLARYKELHDNNDAKTRNWSVASMYYMKATVIWPDGGNSHNQLALLATYVGDEFLALYHCVRSLAVKEPFPDAWNNLMLLFEKNQSTFLHSVSSEVSFDFSNPSARIWTNLQRKIDKNGYVKTEPWHLFIRLIGYFLTKKRSEDFCCTLGSTLAELEALMELDDTELRAGLESYQQMGASRTGPFRVLQIVSVLIFVIKHQTDALKQIEMESVNATQQLESVQLSLVAAFTCIGRLVDRCLKFSPLHSCPILPGVLVFLEWLAIEMDEVDAHCGNDKVLKASCYFVDGVVKLLNLIKITRANGVNKCSNTTALWEDFELQGFVHLDKAQATLDFSDHIGNRKNFENGKDCRFTRLCNSAVSLARRTGLSRQWICYNPSLKTFSLPSLPDHLNCSASQLSKPESTEIGQRALDIGDNSNTVDEEEVILFKPIVRHNSAPIQKSAEKESINPATNDPQQLAMDECLRRSKSFLVTESQLNTNSADMMYRESQLKIAPPELNPMFSNFAPDKLLKNSESSKESSSPPRNFQENNNSFGRGPPSLNAWVLEKGSSSTDWPKDFDSICKSYLKPIEVAANKSLSHLSSTQGSVTSSSQFSPVSPKYSNGSPPALTPRLGAVTTLSPQGSVSDLSTGYFSSPRLIDEVIYPNTTKSERPLSPIAPTSPGKHRPLSGMLTSSEWLRQYREKQGLKQQSQNSPMSPTRSYTPPRTYTMSPDDTSIELYDRWGNPVVSVPKMNLPIPPPFSGLGGERASEKLPPAAYGFMNEVEEEPRPLLQYLKEREIWRTQQKQHSRSRTPPPAYMKT